MNLTRLDKAAIATTAAAAAFKVLLWSVGASLAGAEWWLPWVRWLFALVSFVAFDLVVLAVVADQRAYGRRWLGTATMTAAALLSGGVALHVAGVVAWPWLHAGPAGLLLLLSLHLSDTRGASGGAPAPLQVTQAVQVNVQGTPALHQMERPALQVVSPTARIKDLARQAGVSESTMRRRVERGEVTL